jgi:ligand-binding SRPBCC domain-containing protein
MRKPSSLIFSLCLFAAVVSTRAQQPSPHYVYNGRILQVVDEDSALAKYQRWQVWLYEEGVRIPRYTAGLQYSRWGLIEGTSAENAMKQLQALQSFEAAYLRFFGSGTWGRYTFFNPVGPIAVLDPALEDQPAALEKRYQLRWLQERVNTLILAATPSLENNQSQGPTSPVEGYFEQIRDSLRRVSKLHRQLSRYRPQLRFIESGIVQAKTQVTQAESDMSKITAVLPTVKLPTRKTWMSHAEKAGSDGTVHVDVAETGSGVSVQQTWTGGDGSMTGTVIITKIPYADIGKIDFEPPTGHGDDTWTVRVQSASTPFPQTVDSPERKTARGRFPAVHDASTENSTYFVFQDSRQAQDAYAYFLYHKQLGR